MADQFIPSGKESRNVFSLAVRRILPGYSPLPAIFPKREEVFEKSLVIREMFSSSGSFLMLSNARVVERPDYREGAAGGVLPSFPISLPRFRLTPNLVFERRLKGGEN